MTNTTIPSPPTSPSRKPAAFKRKRLSITLPPILDVCTKRTKTTSTASTMIAPSSLDTQLLKDYLLQGGSLTSEKQGRCLLCCACQCHSMDALQLLVSSGLPCQHLCQDDVSAVHVAAAVGFLQGLTYLLSCQHNETIHKKYATSTTVNINGVTKQDNHTPLYRAVQANQPVAVAYLLEKGARVDIPDRMGRFPLHIAIMNRHLDCVSYLMDYERLSKNNPSHSNITGQPKSSLSPLLTYDHQSAIDDAVMAGYAPILDRLLQQSHSTSSPLSKQEQSELLDLAVQWNRVECLKLLLHHGYDVNYTKEKRNNTSSLLYKAVQQRKMDMVKVLCKAGAISCQNGHNPCLLYAANHGFLEMIPYLLTTCTSNDCIHQAVTLAAPLENRQQLLSIIIHTLKNISSTSSFNTAPLTPISP
ncbi:unnamed protein product [Absidia cylindrospora]